MVVKKFNYVKFISVIVGLVAILTIIIVGIVSLIKHVNYTKTYDYKLENIGYNESEIKIIKNKLKDEYIDKLLSQKYNSELPKLLEEKYFIFDNMDKYIEYKKENEDIDYTKVVSIINSEANVDWLDEEKQTDTSKNELMLVNRIYGLSKDYQPDDIIDIPSQYAYSGKKISESIMENIIELISAGKEAGYTFVVSDGYRSYSEQEEMYNSYVKSYGQSEADEIVARPGHSEYQTGLSFDLMPYNKVFEDSKLSEEYLWLKDNAYKYGFIFRYEDGKEDLTGFRASTWRLRYVGESASTLIYNENITFEEYYAYFVK